MAGMSDPDGLDRDPSDARGGDARDGDGGPAARHGGDRGAGDRDIASRDIASRDTASREPVLPGAPPAVPPVVTDPNATQILLDHGRRSYLEPFMRAERSTSEAAAELGVSVKDMAYRVQRMVRLGLLAVTAEEPRAGRPVKRYRAPTRFFVPFAVLPEADLVEMFEALVTPLQGGLLQGLVRAVTDTEWNVHDWGYRVELNDKDEVSVIPLSRAGDPSDHIYDLIVRGDAPAVFLSYAPLRLDFARAKELQRDLIALLERYQGDRGGTVYWVSAGLAPVR